MTVDVTTLALAVDSTQVSSANAVLDKFAAAGERAEGASARLAKASADHGRAIANTLVPAAAKGAVAFKSLAEAQETLGPAAAAQLAAAGAFGDVAAQATTAATAVRGLNAEAQRGAQTWREFLGQRMGPAMRELADQGVPQKDAHTAAIRQIAAEWQQYKAAGVGAQAAVAAQARATTAAINAMGTAVQQAGAKVAARSSGGLDALAADASHAKAEITDLSKATTSLGASSFVNFDKVTTSLGATAAKADEAALAVHRLRTEVALTGPLANATTSLGATTGPSSAGLRGAIEQRDAEERARRALDPRLAFSPAPAVNPAAARPAIAANEAIGKSAKFAAFQQQQLGFQIHDFFVQVASGSNPLTAFIQQGSQLSGTFGGAGNAFRAVVSLITPMRAAIGAAAVSVGALVLVLARAESAARDLATVQAQLAGTGRQGLFSTAELKAFINELALAPGVTRDSATAIVSELSKVHAIGGGLFKDLGRLTADYAKATGTDIPAAAKALAKAFSDPEKGAKQLDDALGTLTSTQLLQIEALTREGRTAEAQRVLFEALQSSVRGLADNAMTPLQRSVNDLGNAWEKALQRLDQSEGLRTLNSLLAQTVGFVTFLVNNADKVGGLANIGFGMVPGALPGAASKAVGSQLRSAIFGEPTKNPTSSGKVTDLSGAGGGAPGSTGNAADDEIKRAIGAAKAYQSQKGQLADLADERKRFNSALQQSVAMYGKESEQAKKLRDAIAGVDEKAASIRKRGAGGGHEPQQVLDAQLEQRLKASRDILERERDAMAFQQRYLQGAFQAGQLSLQDFYEEKRATIARGTAAELAELDRERVEVEKHLAATKKTSPKDASALVKDQTRLAEIDAQAEKVRLAGGRELVLADQQQAEALKQLTEQVLNYRASLLQLQGDELGAARVRAKIAQNQLKTLAAQSQRSDSPITAADLAAYERAIDTQNRLEAAKRATSQVNEILAQEEDRIALAVRTGAISELDAMQRSGAARAKVAAQLEEIVKAQEEIASRAENRNNWQLQIDTSRARLELEKLKAELDPLKEKFDGMFKDAGANFLDDLMNGAKPRDALKSFFGSIGREVNSVVSKELSSDLFGRGGALGGAGGFLARMFGKKAPGEAAGAAQVASAPVVDTSGVTASLANLQAAGADPATAALGRLQAAADAAAGSLGTQPVPGVPFKPAVTTGDFARLDRGQTSGESAVMDLFKDAGKSGAELARVNEVAATNMLQFASAAARGGDAMSLLPGIVQSILVASSASAARGGSGLFGALGSLFGGGGTFTGTTGLEGLSPDTLALFFHSGGIVGKDKDPRAVPPGIFASAGRYHSGGMVGGAAKEPRLAADEVPAILMGGPKGKREEVLTASDPRHRDNIPPALMHVIEQGPAGQIAELLRAARVPGDRGRAFALSVVGGRGVERGVAGAPGNARGPALKAGEMPAILLRNEEVITANDPRHRDRMTPQVAGAFASARRYHTGGIVGLMPDRRLDVLRPVRNPYLNATKDAGEAPKANGGDTYLTVQVTAAPGVTREQAMNQGRDIGRQILLHGRQRARNT